MQQPTRVDRNLLAISLFSTFLIFCLSGIFWFGAYVQREASAQLTRSTLPEDTLFRLASSLGEERRVIHTILATENPDSGLGDKLNNASTKSKELLDLSIFQIQESRQNRLRLIDHRYDNDTIANLILELQDGLDRISQTSSLIYLETTNHPKDRDEWLRMQIFDRYGNLINQVNNLRLRTHFVPSRNDDKITSIINLNNAIWKLQESVVHNSALLEGFLIKDSNGSSAHLDSDGILFRVYQQIQNAKQALFEINEFSERSVVGGNLGVQLAAFEKQFSDDYVAAEKKLISDLTTGTKPEITPWQWQSTADKFSVAIQDLASETVKQAVGSSQAMEESAVKTLLLDTMLVMLCVGMAIASTRIAQRVQHQSTHDELTKLPNRRLFRQTIDQAVNEASLTKSTLALLTIDLNRFKAINDSMGHSVGDSLLKQVALRLDQCADERMHTARLGGDEFAMLFKPDNHDEAIKVAEKIVTAIEKSFPIDEGIVNIGTSIGISFFPQDARDAADLQVNSDYAMFFAKRDGKQKRKSNVYLYNREMAEEFEERLKLERDLAIAIDSNQLELYYQPQFNLAVNQVDAVEALVRWNHPERGIVPPDSFIGVAEECGLMPALGNWVLNEACRQASIWRDNSSPQLRIAINVSAHQIEQPEFVPDVLYLLKKYSLNADAIELELTESVFMADTEWVINSLSQLREAGIKIALDDFGTGYSSLSQLQDLPINTLKIDRTFISRLGNDTETSQSITATIASIADTFGLETVAEGVESGTQLDQVSDLGIDVVQGYLYSKPLRGNDIPNAVFSINSEQEASHKAA